MKYKKIDDVKPNPVAYIQAYNSIKLGVPKKAALKPQNISEEDYDDNIQMVLDNYEDWVARS